MKGVVFNLLESFVLAEHGPEAWESVLERSGLQAQVQVGPADYPDADLFRLLDAAAAVCHLERPELTRRFGRFCFPRLVRFAPDFVTPFRDPKAFLMTLDSVVHVEVRKLLPHADPPRFLVQDDGPGRLRMTYESPRGMFDFAEGLLFGVAEHFGRTLELRRRVVPERPEQSCVFELEFGER